jgi:vitamin B12 transporter
MYYNVNREKRQGLEVNLTSKLSEQWKVHGGYSYSQVKQKAAAGDFTVDPLTSRPNGYSLGVQYNQDKWDASLTMLAASGRNTKAYTSSSYLTLDLVTRYQLDKDTQIYLKGYNLTNEAYERISYSATVAGKYPMPGRNISVGMERRF